MYEIITIICTAIGATVLVFIVIMIVIGVFNNVSDAVKDMIDKKRMKKEELSYLKGRINSLENQLVEYQADNRKFQNALTESGLQVDSVQSTKLKYVIIPIAVKAKAKTKKTKK